MACISKHGTELARIDSLTSRIAYMSDGNIMRNIGQGWKLYKRVKPDGSMTIAQLANRAIENHRTMAERRPARFAFQNALHSAAPLSWRWKIVQALELLGDDVDGAWSTLDDDHETSGQITIDDMVELAQLYKSCIDEQNAMKEAASIHA